MADVNVLVIYATDYGSTQRLAEAVAEGARGVAGTTAVVKTADETTADDLTAADVIIMGSPVHMGSPDWRIKKLIDGVFSRLWMGDKLVGKVGAVFTTGGGFGSAGGGAEITQLAMLNNIAECGMLIVPFPKCSPGYAKAG